MNTTTADVPRHAAKVSLIHLVGTVPALFGGSAGAHHDEATTPPAVYQTAATGPDPYSKWPGRGHSDRLKHRQPAAFRPVQETAG